MKRKVFNILLLLFALSFIGLLLSYVLDGNWKATRSRLHEVGKEVGHDYMLSSLNVTSMAQDARKLMWIGTSAGVNVFNGKDYTQYFHDSKDTTALPDDYVNVVHRDGMGCMWVGTQNGLARYMGADRFKRYALPDRNRNIIGIRNAEGRRGTVVVSNGQCEYVVDDNGVKRLDRKKCNVYAVRSMAVMDSVSPVYVPFLEKPKDMISCVAKDAGENEWVGYRNGGYQVLSNNIVTYLQTNRNALVEATKGKDIISLRRVGPYILAGTTLRLYVYDTRSGSLSEKLYSSLFHTEGYHDKQVELVDIIPVDEVRFCMVSTREILDCTVASHDSGDLVTRTLYQTDAGRGEALGMGTMSGHSLYISADGNRLLTFDMSTGQASDVRVPSPWYDSETQLAALHEGRLLLFMKNMQVAVYDARRHQLHTLPLKHVPSGISIDPAFAMQDRRGKVWLGTKRYGLYLLNLDTRELEYSHIVNDVHVQGMTEDARGQLWITTLKDAVCYHPTDGTVMMNSLVSSSQNGWQRQFFDNAVCLTPDGCIVLGSSDGCIFLPSASGNKYLSSNKYVKGNRLLTYDHGTSLEGGLCIYALEAKTRAGKHLSVEDERMDGQSYTFAHDENSLTFRFFYPNYTRRSALLYQYKLEGLDEDWRTPTYDNMAMFENLPAGHYRFHLRLLSSLSRPPLAERVVDICVKPAPWACAAAWLLYAALAVALLVYIDSLYLRIRTNRMLLLNEQREKDRERHTNEMNMNFFANITHEFRNPLTIIAGPLISLKSDETVPPSVRSSLNHVCVSVNRMLRLIDQMLDFNQLESDALRLQVARRDVSAALAEWTDLFRETTSLRGISLDYRQAEGDYHVLIDMDKLEKIVSNLFTNALKHTPDGGSILIDVSISGRQHQELAMRIFNSGSHLPEDRMDDVFKRYYQQEGTPSDHSYGWGTGIGLYYVKRLVGLHHGYIEVANVETEEMRGVAFSFTLPVSSDAYAEADYAVEPKSVMQVPVDRDGREYDVQTSSDGDKDKAKHGRTRILVVDDDVDVAQYVRSIFAQDYEVVNRYSAESALADMGTICPDIVLSDVVMDGMTGYEFCRTMKSDLMYSHIPFVLITAKSEMHERIEGLKLGAVAYVTKPFDPRYLQALVASQLDHVLSLRKRLGENVETTHLEDVLSDTDRKFMDELYGLMEKRSAELDLNVQTVCRDLLISQSKFTYKLKQLTGDTPGVFFRKYKLNKAANLLKEKKYNVSEVAVITGFATAAHFSVAFKKHFGVSPSEYVLSL